MPILGAEMDN